MSRCPTLARESQSVHACDMTTCTALRATPSHMHRPRLAPKALAHGSEQRERVRIHVHGYVRNHFGSSIRLAPSLEGITWERASVYNLPHSSVCLLGHAMAASLAEQTCQCRLAGDAARPHPPQCRRASRRPWSSCPVCMCGCAATMQASLRCGTGWAVFSGPSAADRRWCGHRLADAGHLAPVGKARHADGITRHVCPPRCSAHWRGFSRLGRSVGGRLSGRAHQSHTVAAHDAGGCSPASGLRWKKRGAQSGGCGTIVPSRSERGGPLGLQLLRDPVAVDRQQEPGALVAGPSCSHRIPEHRTLRRKTACSLPAFG